MRRRAAAVAVLLALLAAAPAAGDPAPTAPPTVITPAPTDSAFEPVEVKPDLSKPVQIVSDSVVQTDGGSILHLPPGRYYRENVWAALDTEIRRLQAAETRLAAENASLHKTLGGWQPGWWTLVTVLSAGAAGGWYLRGKL